MSKLTTYSLKKEKCSFEQSIITCSTDTVKVLRQFFLDDIEIFESFFLLLLNRANKVEGYVKISQGGITGTVADPLLIAKYAVSTLSKSVILCHNHPSGNLKPSKADEQLTAKVKAGLALFDISVLDHIILTADSYYSFTDEGIL